MHSCWLHTAICSSAAAGAFEPRAHTAQSCRRFKACRKPQHLSRPKPASTAQQIMMLTQTCLPCPHLFVFDPICFHSLRQSAHHKPDATKIDGSNTNLKSTDFTLLILSSKTTWPVLGRRAGIEDQSRGVAGKNGHISKLRRVPTDGR